MRVFLSNDGTFSANPSWQFAGFGSGNTEGKVVLSSCDTNNDGINEIIVGQGPNAGNVIRIFDYGNATPSNQFTSFGSATNGINIACGELYQDCFDNDNDGYTTCENDCNDTDVNINPGASEICDSLDNNCNGIVDEDCQFTCDDANNGIGCGNVLLMHMDELNGTIKDYSGEQNNGVESGGVTYGVSGKLGTALSFDGNDDHIIVNDNNSLDITNALTISAWVNSNVLLNTIQSIISKWASQVIFDGSSFSSYYVSLLTSNFDYYGGVFDGRYVYYVPLNNNGNVLRYDTQDNFASMTLAQQEG
ncbi:putative metal-binding motif-containing protein [Candidatus Woesearchaeota archaeon]|nr:putative metal-binding motif-containing protein [Candidatus Woesearchaeota archaeon]